MRLPIDPEFGPTLKLPVQCHAKILAVVAIGALGEGGATRSASAHWAWSSRSGLRLRRKAQQATYDVDTDLAELKRKLGL